MEECKQTKSSHKLGSDLSEILEKRQQRSEATDAEALQSNYEQNIQASIDVSRMLSRKEVKEYRKLFNK